MKLLVSLFFLKKTLYNFFFFFFLSLGNITMNEIYNKFNLTSNDTSSDNQYKSNIPIAYWRLKAGIPDYFENIVSY